MITIEKAKREDMFPVLELIKEGGCASNPSYPAFLAPVAPGHAVYQVDMAIKAGSVRVARTEDKTIVGVIVTSFESYVWNGQPFVNTMFVYLAPAARKGMNGMTLVKALRDIGKETGQPIMVTIHDVDGHSALLERAGFKKVSSIFMFGD